MGKSILPIFRGKQREAHTETYCHFNRAHAVRQGESKAIRAGKAWKLYDLQNDPTELSNLSTKMPIKTGALTEIREEWNQECKSRPE